MASSLLYVINLILWIQTAILQLQHLHEGKSTHYASLKFLITLTFPVVLCQSYFMELGLYKNCKVCCSLHHKLIGKEMQL